MEVSVECWKCKKTFTAEIEGEPSGVFVLTRLDEAPEADAIRVVNCTQCGAENRVEVEIR